MKNIRRKETASFMKRRYILKKIRHSNIIRLFEVFENKKHIMMVMEYAGGGDLFHLVKKSKYLTEDETKYVFKKIA